MRRTAAPASERLPEGSLAPVVRPRPVSTTAELQRAIGNQALQRWLRGNSPVEVPSSLPAALADGGAPLPRPLRDRAESFFGADLSHVRLHTGASAARVNRELDARASTVGSDILLRDGGDAADQRLLAHELAHAVQGAGRAETAIASPNDAAEREAHAAADAFVHAAPSATLRQSRSAAIHRDARHPTATVLDADYLLYALDGVDYDSATQHYYISPQDRARLRRINGVYVIEWSELSLITPPEIRRAAGSRGVLIPIGNFTLAPLRASVGPGQAAQFVMRLAERALGVTVPSVTLSRGPNEDFTVVPLPAGVRTALGTPLEGVSASQTAGVESARAIAAGATQARTISSADLRGEELPMRELSSSDRMDVGTMFGRDDAGRAQWYAGRLATLQAQLLESARGHNLPMQLLAAVILNELADINRLDVWQGGPSTYAGSLGIAQIQVETARRDRLIDIGPGAHRTGWRLSGGHAHDIDHPAMVAMGERLRIGQLLQVPQLAIEAAAREIEILLGRMGANRTRPWQVDHSFNAPGPEGTAIYTHVGSASASQQTREGLLADAVCGAYNSPDVITAADTTRFRNATIHGGNANALAQDLYRFRLFRSA
jgi:hypothetical protein